MTLFTSFTTATASAITGTELLINDLQQQLEYARQQLASLQQQQQLELTAKGAAESALDTARKAFKAVFMAYGQDGVDEFKNALIELVDENAPLTLPGTVEPQPEPQPKPQPEPTPSPTIETTVITVVEPEPQPQPQPSETTVTTETKEAKKQTTLPTLEQIGKMTKPELIKYLTAYQQPTKGFSRDLKARLSNFVMSQQLNIKEQQQAA